MILLAILLTSSLPGWSSSGVENEAISIGILHLRPKTIWYGERAIEAWGVLFNANVTMGRCWPQVPGDFVMVLRIMPMRMPFLLSTLP